MEGKKDPYHAEMLAHLPENDQREKDEKRIIGLKVHYAVELQRAFKEMAPGCQIAPDITVRSLSVTKRKKDGLLFLILKATEKKPRKDDRDIVTFGSGDHLGEAMYEMWQRAAGGTAKWRDDVPWDAENEHDRPEPLPKWE